MDTNDETLYSIRELWECVKRKKKWIFLAAFVFSIWGAWYGAIRPVTYTVEASFKDRGKKGGGGFGGTLSQLLMGSVKSQSEAASMMQSRVLLEPMIQKYGMQVSGHRKGISFWSRMGTNLQIEWAKFMKKGTIVIDQRPSIFAFRDVRYEGDFPLKITLGIESDGAISVLGPHGESLGKGDVGVPFACGDFCFTLVVPSGERVEKRTLSLVVQPMELVAAGVQGMLDISVDKKDATLLDIKFTYADREFGIHFLDDLMARYQVFLKEQHDQTAALQLAYLEKRKGQILSDQKRMMYTHAEDLSETLRQSGFIDSEKVLDHLLAQQLNWVNRTEEIELEMKRLTHLLEKNTYSFEQSFAGTALRALQPLLQELEQLKEQRDTLSLALQVRAEGELIALDLNEPFSNLGLIETHLNEIRLATEAVQRGEAPPEELSLFQYEPYRLQAWLKQLALSSQNHLEREDFLLYLQQLGRLLEIKRDLLHERLTHQYDSDPTFQGLDLVEAKSIYTEYCHECNRLEAKSARHQFVLAQMESPDFEINSLSSTLDDSVSQKMIERSSELALQLREEHTRSEKERARVKNTIGIHKQFLAAHLVQTKEVDELSQNLLLEKMRALQGIMLELIHQKVSLLQKRIQEFITEKIVSSEQEKEMIHAHLQEVNEQMSFLPQQWVSEKLIKQNLDMNQSILEEVTRLVEGKNISHHMSVIQSEPIDAAHGIALPNSPRILLLALVGAFLGLFGGVALVIGKEVVFGPEARIGNLELMGSHVAGKLTRRLSEEKLFQTDVETVRRMAAFLSESRMHPCSLLLLSHGPNYTYHLAGFLSEMGKRVLVVDLTFSGGSEEGILPYIEGKKEEIAIQTRGNFDFVPSGGITPWGCEKVLSYRFKTWLHRVACDYDHVLAYSLAPIDSAESEMILSLFTKVVVTVDGERIETLKPYLGERFSFVVLS